MTYEIEINGHRRAVTLQREGDEWVIAFDGRRLVATLVEVGGRGSLLVRRAEPGEGEGTSGGGQAWRSYEVSFDSRGGGEQVVHVGGEPVLLSMRDPRAMFRGRARERAAGDAGPDSVMAPMPGRVVKVLVAPGDAVVPRQGVVVVEAMKMENELRAARAGTVREVRVREGTSVEAKAVLVVIE